MMHLGSVLVDYERAQSAPILSAGEGG